MRTAWFFGIAATLVLTACPSAETPADESTSDDPESSSGMDGSDSQQPVTTMTPSTSSTTDDMGSSDESGEPAGECGNNKVCLGKPPLGWTGPVVVAKGQVADDLPNCRDAYPMDDVVRFEGFNVPGDAECTCACGLSGATCTMNYYYDPLDGATSCFTNYINAVEGCNEIAMPFTNGALYASTYVGFGASCDQQAEEVIPELAWDAVVTGCRGEVDRQDICDANGSLCYKKPNDRFDEQICYIAAGDIPCPPNTDYQEKTIRYSAFDDSRDCTSCQCGMISTCIDEYDYYANTDCSGAPMGQVTNNSCTTGVNAGSVMFDLSGLSCPILSESEPEGEVTPLDEWTYCCAAY